MSVSDGANLLVLYVMNLLCFMSDGLVSSMLARLGNYYVSWIMLSSLTKNMSHCYTVVVLGIIL